MINIVMFILLLIVIIPFGIEILRVFTKAIFLNPLEQSFLGFGLGAGILALLILTIGLLGFLYKNLIVGLLCILFLVLQYPIELLKKNRFLRHLLKRPPKTYYWQQYFKAGRLKNILENRGFKVVEIRPMDYAHSIISFSKLFRDKNTYDGVNSTGLAFNRF